MPYLSREEIGNIARRVLEAYRKLPEAQEEKTRVDPEILAGKLLHLTVDHRRLTPDGNILGVTSCVPTEVLIVEDGKWVPYPLDGNTVLIEKSLVSPGSCRGRYHYTLMHECGHQIYKLLFPNAYGVPGKAFRLLARGDDRDWEEWRTDRLTAELLMPEDLVRENLDRAGLPGVLPALRACRRDPRYRRFCAVAEEMGVSRQALAIRLQGLGILDRADLWRPPAVSVWKETDEQKGTLI